MRIGMMADVYKPHVSGVTNYISLNKEYLENAGHEVFVFTFGDEDYHDEETNIIRSPGLPLVDTGYYLSLRHNQQAQKQLRKMDVVHVHHPFLSGNLTQRYCKPRGIPIIFTSHTRYDLLTHTYLPALPDSAGETVLKAYLPNFCQSVDLVIAPSRGMREMLLRVNVDTPIEVVPNGVDMTPFQGRIQPVDRKQLGFESDDIVLVYSGRLAPEKNIPFLLRSFNGAAKAFDNLCLLIVGDGPERENLEDRVRHMGIERKVHFTGMVEYSQIPRYLAIADGFVTASVAEVHPLSVIEAMAAGLPVLGIASPGMSDIIEEGKTGFVSEDDLAAFTAKMVRMVTDHDLRQKMSLRACEISEIYAIERTTKIMLEHYTRLVDISIGRKRGLRTRWVRFWDGVRQ